MVDEDPRVEGHICGESFISAKGREWVCIRKPHGSIYMRRNGRMSFQTNGAANQHHFVPRWPHRNKEKLTSE